MERINKNNKKSALKQKLMLIKCAVYKHLFDKPYLTLNASQNLIKNIKTFQDHTLSNDIEIKQVCDKLLNQLQNIVNSLQKVRDVPPTELKNFSEEVDCTSSQETFYEPPVTFATNSTCEKRHDSNVSLGPINIDTTMSRNDINSHDKIKELTPLGQIKNYKSIPILNKPDIQRKLVRKRNFNYVRKRIQPHSKIFSYSKLYRSTKIKKPINSKFQRVETNSSFLQNTDNSNLSIPIIDKNTENMSDENDLCNYAITADEFKKKLPFKSSNINDNNICDAIDDFYKHVFEVLHNCIHLSTSDVEKLYPNESSKKNNETSSMNDIFMTPQTPNIPSIFSKTESHWSPELDSEPSFNHAMTLKPSQFNLTNDDQIETSLSQLSLINSNTSSNQKLSSKSNTKFGFNCNLSNSNPFLISSQSSTNYTLNSTELNSSANLFQTQSSLTVNKTITAPSCEKYLLSSSQPKQKRGKKKNVVNNDSFEKTITQQAISNVESSQRMIRKSTIVRNNPQTSSNHNTDSSSVQDSCSFLYSSQVGDVKNDFPINTTQQSISYIDSFNNSQSFNETQNTFGNSFLNGSQSQIFSSLGTNTKVEQKISKHKISNNNTNNNNLFDKTLIQQSLNDVKKITFNANCRKKLDK